MANVSINMKRPIIEEGGKRWHKMEAPAFQKLCIKGSMIPGGGAAAPGPPPLRQLKFPKLKDRDAVAKNVKQGSQPTF